MTASAEYTHSWAHSSLMALTQQASTESQPEAQPELLPEQSSASGLPAQMPCQQRCQQRAFVCSGRYWHADTEVAFIHPPYPKAALNRQSSCRSIAWRCLVDKTGPSTAPTAL